MDDTVLDRGLASLRTRALVSKIIIYIFIGICVLQAAVDIAQLIGAIDLQALPDQETVDAIDGLFAGASVLYLVSAVIIAFWIHRAHKNLFDAGYGDLEFTPGWSVGWFLIPIASLYMPYKAMRELWHVSLGDHDGRTGSAPAELSVWWGTFLVGNFAAYGTAIPAIDLLSVTAQAVSALLMRVIIVRVTDGQVNSLRIGETFA